MSLMLSVSGCRGIVGESLTPEVAVRFAGTLGAWLKRRAGGRRPRVVLGRDGRAGGEMVKHAAVAGLLGAGCDVIDVGVAMTPTVGFATDLHHVALMAIRDSYMIFSPKEPLMFGDAAQTAIQSAASAFVIGIQMSAPFIVFGLVFNLGAGILARLMPALQVYFLLMPANIFIGLALFAMLLVMMMGWYLSHFEAHLAMWRG